MQAVERIRADAPLPSPPYSLYPMPPQLKVLWQQVLRFPAWSFVCAPSPVATLSQCVAPLNNDDDNDYVDTCVIIIMSVWATVAQCK